MVGDIVPMRRGLALVGWWRLAVALVVLVGHSVGTRRPVGIGLGVRIAVVVVVVAVEVRL